MLIGFGDVEADHDGQRFAVGGVRLLVLKIAHRVATRYHKTGESFIGFIITSIRL